MGRVGKCFAVSGVLSLWLATASFAADAANDAYTFYGVARPQGPATASYLRMHHPLYLLDRCRQVKAGTLGRQKVEGFVGRHTLDALLGMDLDALYQRLTDPAAGPPVVPPAGGPPPRSLWDRILTNDGTAPPPSPDLPAALDFGDVGRGDSPTRSFRVTSPTDGFLEATLPAGSPYQILSMQTYTGVMVSVPAALRHPNLPFLRRGDVPQGGDFHGPTIERARTYRVPELARQQAPTQVPVQAGQDVDILVGLPTTPAVPPGDMISSTITVGDPVQGAWRQDVPILAQSALKGDIKIIVGEPQPLIDLVEDLFYYPNVPYQFVVPVTVSSPNPPVTVKGIIEPYSLPQGVSMQNVGFVLQPNQTLTLSVLVWIDRGSPAWASEEVPQAFSFQVSYQTTSIPLASRKEVAEFIFTKYSPVQTWRVSAKPGGVECTQDVMVYSTGWTVRSGWCDNRNAYTANVTAIGSLASIGMVQFVYQLGWFDQKFTSFASSIPFFQSNYVYVRDQPLLVTWTKY